MSRSSQQQLSLPPHHSPTIRLQSRPEYVSPMNDSHASAAGSVKLLQTWPQFSEGGGWSAPIQQFTGNSASNCRSCSQQRLISASRSCKASSGSSGSEQSCNKLDCPGERVVVVVGYVVLNSTDQPLVVHHPSASLTAVTRHGTHP
jgi:hypothetical protein